LIATQPGETNDLATAHRDLTVTLQNCQNTETISATTMVPLQRERENLFAKPT